MTRFLQSDINTIFISFILLFIIFHPTLFLRQASFDKSVLAPSQPPKLLHKSFVRLAIFALSFIMSVLFKRCDFIAACSELIMKWAACPPILWLVTQKAWMFEGVITHINIRIIPSRKSSLLLILVFHLRCWNDL